MKVHFKQILIFIFLIGNSYFDIAQKINYSNFFLFQDNKQITLHWSIDSGPTCNGITILRSLDTLNFEVIGNILGVCGNITSSQIYYFTDTNPISSNYNFYKLRLGYGQFTKQNIFI